MRFLLQILGLILIACIGWNQPFCDLARTFMPWAQIPPSRLSLIKAKAQAATMTPVPTNSSFNPLAPPAHR
jgi:hypothetical protein